MQSSQVLLAFAFSVLFVASVTTADPLVALQIQDDAGSISMGEAFDVNITRTASGDLSINTDVSVVGDVTATGAVSAVRAQVSGAVSATTVNATTINASVLNLVGSILADNVITSARTYTVGSGKDFPTLLAAWNAVAAKVLLARVTIQLQSMSMAGTTLENAATSWNIFIRGDLTDSSRVVLTASNVANLLVFNGPGASATIGGFTLIPQAGVSGLVVQYGAIVTVQETTTNTHGLIVGQGGYQAVQVLFNSVLRAERGLNITSLIGLTAGYASTVLAPNSVFNGITSTYYMLLMYGSANVILSMCQVRNHASPPLNCQGGGSSFAQLTGCSFASNAPSTSNVGNDCTVGVHGQFQYP